MSLSSSSRSSLRRLVAGSLPLALFACILARPAPAHADEADGKAPRVSLAIERIGGFSYTKVSAKDSDNSASLTAFALGGVTANPYVAPRLGVDVILDPGITLGAGMSVARFGLSSTQTSNNVSSSTDIGSLFIYTLTPRVGYRAAVSPDFDITPRAGVTLAGGSASSGDGKQSYGVFALALSGEAVAAWRATRSFNLLAGLGLDYTVTASSSSSGSSGTSTSSDIKGGLFAGQLWLGMGGYL